MHTRQGAQGQTGRAVCTVGFSGVFQQMRCLGRAKGLPWSRVGCPKLGLGQAPGRKGGVSGLKSEPRLGVQLCTGNMAHHEGPREGPGLAHLPIDTYSSAPAPCQVLPTPGPLHTLGPLSGALPLTPPQSQHKCHFFRQVSSPTCVSLILFPPGTAGSPAEFLCEFAAVPRSAWLLFKPSSGLDQKLHEDGHRICDSWRLMHPRCSANAVPVSWAIYSS